MDTILHNPASMAKRPCPFSSSSSSSSVHNLKLSTKQTQMDHLLQSFLSLAESPSLSIDLSFDRLLESMPCDADQCLLIDRAFELGSLLLQAANRSNRKRASSHNSVVWALPPDLTIKVFSILDSQSLSQVAATCSMFNKWAMDPLCYANIDLTTDVPMVNNAVVSTMIQRAGKCLQSLKLGVVPHPTSSSQSRQPLVYTFRSLTDVPNLSWSDKKSRQGKESSLLTRSCLNPLSGHDCAAGNLLRRLHLYNIERMDNISLHGALLACPHLIDLKMVGLHVELRQTLASVSSNCHLIECLYIESSKTERDNSLRTPTCADLVNNCPNLTSLALRGFKLHDYEVRIFVKGFRNLKYVDFSTSYSITGYFLRNLERNTGGTLLEVLILRDCMHLKVVEVAQFLTAILEGHFKFLQYLDISNREGLASEGDLYRRYYSTSAIPLEQVRKERPRICLLAEFPSDGSYTDIEQTFDSDLTSGEINLPSHYSNHLSQGSILVSTSESSYSSDQGSGNEDAQDSGYAVFEESSDEIDFLVI